MNSSEDFSKNVSFAFGNWTHLDDDDLEEEIISRRPLLHLMYSFIILALFIIGVPVNLMICGIVARTEKLQKSMNIFFFFLFLVDTVMIIKISVLTLAEEIFSKWIFGKFMCTLVVN
jgi:hypothetical protein